ncbi:hypothetical protein [Polyangium sp. 6x1]|uniref:hypothetical protein n=1 Tax=Polyangium sp. 6x1 TaxID=3042689 RepID=UPI0024825891|nr:hypothetical protein [Polyangium sp. 6x1]MDI1451505.1 hypothetical protein [Polyangium sp. 6x1]
MWLLSGCLGPLTVDEDGSGGAGAGGHGGAACALELCHTSEVEGTCGGKVCASVGWSVRIGDAAHQGASALAVSSVQAEERLYVTGRYRGAMTLGSQILSEGGLGLDDAYVASVDGYGTNGLALNVGMADAAGAPLGHVPRVGLGVAADDGASVFVVGSHRSNDPAEPTVNLDAFVRSFNPGASKPVQWTRTFGGGGPDKAVAVTAVGSSAFVAATLGAVPGIATETVLSCKTNEGHTVPAGEEHLLLAHYAGDGQCQWVLPFSGGIHRPTAMISSPTGDVYVTGSYVGLLVDPAGEALPTAIDDAAFVLKLDTSGTVVWRRMYGSSSSGSRAVPRAMAWLNGNLVVTGSMAGTIDFETGPLVAEKESSFVLSLDEAGTTRWASRIGEAEGIAGVSRGTGVARAVYDGLIVAIDATGSGAGDEGQGAFLANLDEQGRLRALDFLGGGGDAAARSLLLSSGSSYPYIAAAWSSKLRFEPPETKPAGLDVVMGRLNP